MTKPRWSILGTVGVPGNYGGFETLAENLVRYHKVQELPADLSVYCSSKAFADRPTHFEGAELRYIGLDANGPSSVPYDVLSLWNAMRNRADLVLLLGVSGAVALPFVRAFSRCQIVTNIDGIEWKREKWKGLAKAFLRWSERIAVRWSDVVIADNSAIADHVRETYKASCEVIPYGGDHALSATPEPVEGLVLPSDYTIALCRIEPENNISMILEAFSGLPQHPLVFVGNWNKSEYGRALKSRFAGIAHMHLLDPIYDPGKLHWLRAGARAYVHGHSAGGTNPALVEMMHFGIPVFAHGCAFNRHTTEDRATYFVSATELADAVTTQTADAAAQSGAAMQEIAVRRYTWASVGEAYFDLMERTCKSKKP
jgi:glycosyltransferase involved in cell wall biosynthesis